MKRYFAAASAALLLLAGCSGEPAGDFITKTSSIDTGYTSLDISGAIEVTYSFTADEMTVYGQENLLKYFRAENEDGTLSLYVEANRVYNAKPIEVVLPGSMVLSSVSVTGASTFDSAIPLAATAFSVSVSGASEFVSDIEVASDLTYVVSGASKVTGSVTGKSAVVGVSGASKADLSGKVTALHLDVSGASSFVGKTDGLFEADEASCDISGASKAELTVNNTISGSVSGASLLTYYGSATSTVSVTGDSSIDHR